MGKKIPLWQVICVMLFTILLLCYALNIFGLIAGKATGEDPSSFAFSNSYGELHIPLIISAVVAALVAFANGYKWKFLENGIIASIGRSMQACLILLIVGMLIGSWMAGGVVPAMISYGLLILKPSIFLLAACIMCCIVSLATGSSWTTAGTIGIALIGVATGLGISIPMTAGAIVSGAYFGDKMSPLSDTTNMAPAVAGSELFEHIKHMIWTVTPSLIIALIIYTILGFFGHGDAADTSTVDALREALGASFKISPLLLIPPCVVIVIVALKIPAIPGLLAGVLLGVFAMAYQGVPAGDWFGVLHYGYAYEVSDSFNAVADQIGVDFFSDDVTANTVNEMVAAGTIEPIMYAEYSLVNLLSHEGMTGMLWTVNLIICAMCFGGVMDSSGMLGTFAEGLLKFAKGVGSLTVVAVFSCLFINIIAADQYLAIILPGRMYKEAYEDRRLKNKNLSRVLEDSGTLTSPLVPWNTCGATMSTFLGVPTLMYAPFAFLNYICPFVSIFYGFTGISMQKMTEEEYQKILQEREAERRKEEAALES